MLVTVVMENDGRESQSRDTGDTENSAERNRSELEVMDEDPFNVAALCSLAVPGTSGTTVSSEPTVKKKKNKKKKRKLR